MKQWRREKTKAHLNRSAEAGESLRLAGRAKSRNPENANKETVKRKIVFAIGIVITVFLTMLTVGCSGKSSQTPVQNGAFTITADEFENKLQSVISSHEEFSLFEIDSTETMNHDEIDEDDDGTSILIYFKYDAAQVGMIMIQPNEDGYVRQVSTWVSASAVKNSVSGNSTTYINLDTYKRLYAPAFMTLDSSLTIDDAFEIVGNISETDDSTSMNGIQYDNIGEINGVEILRACPAETADDGN